MSSSLVSEARPHLSDTFSSLDLLYLEQQLLELNFRVLYRLVGENGELLFLEDVKFLWNNLGIDFKTIGKLSGKSVEFNLQEDLEMPLSAFLNWDYGTEHILELGVTRAVGKRAWERKGKKLVKIEQILIVNRLIEFVSEEPTMPMWDFNPTYVKHEFILFEKPDPADWPGFSIIQQKEPIPLEEWKEHISPLLKLIKIRKHLSEVFSSKSLEEWMRLNFISGPLLGKEEDETIEMRFG